jgi:hypothetical protein
MDTVCSLTGLVLLALSIGQLVFSTIFINAFSEFNGTSVLDIAGGSSLCQQNQFTLAFANKNSLDIIYLFSYYWVKPCAYLMAAIWVLSIVIKLIGVLSFVLCPDSVYRCKKRYHGIPADYSDFKNEFSTDK